MRHVLPIALAVLLSTVALAPLASAAVRKGDPLTADKNVLYAHYNSDENVYWTSNVLEEPAHDSDAAGWNVLGVAEGNVPEEVCAVNSLPCLHWELPLEPAPSQPVPLEESGSVTFSLFLRSSTAGEVGTGQIDVSTELVVADTTIASTETTTVEMDTSWTEVSWSVAPDASEIPNASQSEATWNIYFSGVANNLLLGMGEGHWSNVSLPVADQSQEVVEKSAEWALSVDSGTASAAPGETVDYDLTVENTGDAASSFKLQAADLPGSFDSALDPGSGEVEAGGSTSSTLSVTVPDGAEPGETSFAVELTADASTQVTADLTVDVVVEDDDPSSDDGSKSTDDGSPDDAGGSAIPAPSVAWILVAALGAALVLARRR